jgi:hypothetical protein
MAGAGHTAGGGANTGNPAKVGRHPDTTAGIAANIQGRPAGGNNRCGPAAATAGALSGIVRVVGPAIDKVVRFAVHG